MQAAIQASIVEYLLTEFSSGEVEAAWGLRRIFPYLNAAFQEQLIVACLNHPKVPESWIAYLVIRNRQYLCPADKVRFIAVIKSFRSEYFRIRCLLVLADQLPHDELAVMVQQFMASFHTEPPGSARMHNLYQISSFLGMSADAVVTMALNKIAQFDDAGLMLYEQEKYQHLSFLTPHLTEETKSLAFAIAATIRGGYRRSMIGRLNRHFAGSRNYCELRGVPICY